MIHASPVLSPSMYFKSLFSSSNDYLENIHQYQYARGALISAIFSIIKKHKLKSSTTVWIPAFICGTIVDLFESYNINYKYYQITDNLLPDWKKVNGYNYSENDIFIIVYYFGFPMGIKKALKFCSINKLFLIEDCAHNIISKIEPEGIGTYGEAGIFGLRKGLPLPHGGFLYMKDTPLLEPNKITTSKSIYRSPLKMIIQWIFIKLKIPWYGSNSAYKKHSLHNHPENYNFFDYTLKMNSISKKITNCCNFNEIIRIRRRNFSIYYDFLKEYKQIKIPTTLTLKSSQATPWVFFFYYDRAEKLINYLRKLHISASDFPELHTDILNDKIRYSIENEFYDKSVTLPIHQDLRKIEIQFIIDKIRMFFKEN